MDFGLEQIQVLVQNKHPTVMSPEEHYMNRLEPQEYSSC